MRSFSTSHTGACSPRNELPRAHPSTQEDRKWNNAYLQNQNPLVQNSFHDKLCNKLLLDVPPSWYYQPSYHNPCRLDTSCASRHQDLRRHALWKRGRIAMNNIPVAFSAKNTDFPQRGHLGAPPSFGGMLLTIAWNDRSRHGLSTHPVFKLRKWIELSLDISVTKLAISLHFFRSRTHKPLLTNPHTHTIWLLRTNGRTNWCKLALWHVVHAELCCCCQDSRAVYVTNISPNANEKTVSDFFSFCGKISKLFVNKYVEFQILPNSVADIPFFREQETSSAVVEFETESAAKTALLLTNALIVDRPITVVPYTSTPSTQQSATGATVDVVPPKNPGTPVAQHEITQRDFKGVPDEQRVSCSLHLLWFGSALAFLECIRVLSLSLSLTPIKPARVVLVPARSVLFILPFLLSFLCCAFFSRRHLLLLLSLLLVTFWQTTYWRKQLSTTISTTSLCKRAWLLSKLKWKCTNSINNITLVRRQRNWQRQQQRKPSKLMLLITSQRRLNLQLSKQSKLPNLQLKRFVVSSLVWSGCGFVETRVCVADLWRFLASLQRVCLSSLLLSLLCCLVATKPYCEQCVPTSEVDCQQSDRNSKLNISRIQRANAEGNWREAKGKGCTLGHCHNNNNTYTSSNNWGCDRGCR